MSPSIKKAAPVKGKPSQAKKGKKLTAGQKILQEMAKFFSRGKQSPGKHQIASVTRLKKKTMANAITKLKKKGLLLAEGSTFALTEEGGKEMDSMIVSGTTNAEVHAFFKGDLKGKQVRMFEFLADGKEHDKEDVAKGLDFSKGKTQKVFQNLLCEMKNKAQLIDYPTKDTVRLRQDICFPFKK